MSRSYRADEEVFQKLRAAGKTSWDEQADPEANFERFVMRPFLEESLAGMPNEIYCTFFGAGTLPLGTRARRSPAVVDRVNSLPERFSAAFPLR